MGLHIMHAPEPSRSVVRRHYILRSPDASQTAAVLSLQGTITFASAERVIRVLSAASAATGDATLGIDSFVLDMRQVYSVDNVAKTILREAVKRLRDAGYNTLLIDPEGVLRVDNDRLVATDDVCSGSVTDLTQFADWKRMTTPPMIRRLTSDRALPRLAMSSAQ